MRKGQFISTMTIFVLIFITSGNIFGAILFQDVMDEEIEYNIGDFTKVANAEIRSEAYIPRMEKELNYSSNIKALQLGEEGTTTSRTWPDIPSKSDLRGEYYEEVQSELDSQSRVAECSEPVIGEVSTDNGNEYTAEIEDPWIVCGGDTAQANISMPENNLESYNHNNRYVPLAESAVDLAEGIQSELPESWDEGTGSASSSCKDNLDRTLYVEQAKQEAKQNAIENENLAADAADTVDLADWIGLDTTTTFETSYTKENENIETCDWTHTGHEVDCSDTDDDGVEECETHIHEGEKVVDLTYSAEITEATLEYDLYDSERQVIDSQADKQTIHFVFEYVHSIG